jgi:hypothetical protein
VDSLKLPSHIITDYDLQGFFVRLAVVLTFIFLVVMGWKYRYQIEFLLFGSNRNLFYSGAQATDLLLGRRRPEGGNGGNGGGIGKLEMKS